MVKAEQPTIKSVVVIEPDLPSLDGSPVNSFWVRLELSDGSSIDQDLEPFLTGPILGQIKCDRNFFKQVKADKGALVWPYGVEMRLEIVDKASLQTSDSLPYGFIWVLFTPLCFIVLPGVALSFFYKNFTGREPAWMEGYISWILLSMGFWAVVTLFSILAFQ